MIYISGAMTGIKDYNYPEFNRVAAGLRSAGHEVFNPAEVDFDKTGMSEWGIYQEYMDLDLQGLEKCNIIYLLKGWENSPGARTELKRAIENNIIIKMQGDIVGEVSTL